MNDRELLYRIRRLIGRHCRHLGQDCTLIEVLADEAALVLSCSSATPPVQTDQFGQPLRRALETRQVALFDGDAISDEAQELLYSFSV